jgi:hypothetical protein
MPRSEWLSVSFHNQHFDDQALARESRKNARTAHITLYQDADHSS